MHSFSTLPEDLEELHVRDLADKHVVYVVHWAMYVDEDRKLWILGSYTYSTEAQGTASMRIRKKGDAIEVDRTTIRDYRWSPGPFCYAGLTKADLIPARIVDHF